MNYNSELDAILSRWPLGTVFSCSLVPLGDVNRNWLVRTSQGAYILREISQHRTIQDLLFEIKYLEHLKSQKFPYATPQPVSIDQSQKFVEHEGFYYCIYRYIEGKVKKQLDLSDLREIARMVALYHEILENADLENSASKTPQIAHTFVAEELAQFKTQIGTKNFKHAHDLKCLEYLDQLSRIHESLHDPSYSKCRTYPIHRDINPENLIWQEEALVGLIDFENVAIMNDTFLKDIGVIIQTCCYDRNDPVQTDLELASNLLKEYESSFSLQLSDLKFLPKILSAGAIEDFAYAYWQLIHDPARADLSRLDFYANVAVWHYQHKDQIVAILEENH
ncbi:MAG: phosphotransferase [Candidatus Thorarchaeota archaeon]